MKYTFFQKIHIAVVEFISAIHWKPWSHLEQDDKEVLFQKCREDYYIIATRRSNNLSTFFIGLSHFLLTGRWGFYSHVLMNTEDTVEDDNDFRFIEATTKGTKFSTLDEVVKNVDAICLIKPVSMTLDEWTTCLDKAKVYLGYPYDNLFNLVNEEEINCVELIHKALKALPDYETRFANFERLIYRKKGKLTPQMFIDCPDFHIVWEVRR